MSSRGRKTKLSRKLIQRAENLVKAGNYVVTVCKFLGIHESTWYRWLQEGEHEKRGLKREFYESIKKAEAEAEVRLLTDQQKISKEKDDWKAIAWILERKFPDRWGRKDRLNANIEHTGKDGGAIETRQEIDLSNLTDEELTQLEKLIEKTDERTD